MITWVHATDCDAPHGLNEGDEPKVKMLEDHFRKHGFDKSKPALVGYPLDGRIQLLTGTHRHEAARRTGVKLPVTLFLRSYVEAYWGTNMWPKLVEDIPVTQLENMNPPPDIKPGLAERVVLPDEKPSP